MKVNPVKQFIKSNISRFEKAKESYFTNRIFNLYDKNNSYRGEYHYVMQHTYGCKPTRSLSSVRILSDKLKQEMAEHVYIDKDFIDLYEPKSEELIKTKLFPKEITTITTVLDFVNDRFQTIRSVSKLKNELKIINNDKLGIIYSGRTVYEPLTEKPQFERSVEVIREGLISETRQKGSSHNVPYSYW